MIIDIHAHYASTMVLPEKFYEGWVKNILLRDNKEHSEEYIKYLLDFYMRQNADDYCTNLIEEMEKANIDKTILLIIDFEFSECKSAHSIEEIYKLHYDLLKKHSDKFIVFAGIDPRRGEEGVTLLRKGIEEYGFQGLKIYPPCGFSPSDERLDKYYEICQEHKIPVLTHIGPSSSNLSFEYTLPNEIAKASHKFPDVNFILGHAGFMHYKDATIIAAYRPNVYLDVSGFQNVVNNSQFLKTIEYLKELGVMHKLLFGTDWPIHRNKMTQIECVKVFQDLKDQDILSSKEYNMLMFENVTKLLKGLKI